MKHEIIASTLMLSNTPANISTNCFNKDASLRGPHEAATMLLQYSCLLTTLQEAKYMSMQYKTKPFKQQLTPPIEVL